MKILQLPLCVTLLHLFIFTELENQLKQQQPQDLKREIIKFDGESSPKVRELEKIIRLLKQEKEEAQKASK
jgi:tellurite resistance protein